jgi:hypothetical protein
MGRVFYEAFRAEQLASPDPAPLQFLPDWPRLTASLRESYRAGADAVLMLADLQAGDAAAAKAAGGLAEAGQ